MRLWLAERLVFYDLEDAVTALHENRADMFETCYDYAVIEEVCEGIYGTIPETAKWFEWDTERQGYYECETPSGAEHVIAYGIG